MQNEIIKTKRYFIRVFNDILSPKMALVNPENSFERTSFNMPLIDGFHESSFQN